MQGGAHAWAHAARVAGERSRAGRHSATWLAPEGDRRQSPASKERQGTRRRSSRRSISDAKSASSGRSSAAARAASESSCAAETGSATATTHRRRHRSVGETLSWSETLRGSANYDDVKRDVQRQAHHAAQRPCSHMAGRGRRAADGQRQPWAATPYRYGTAPRRTLCGCATISRRAPPRWRRAPRRPGRRPGRRPAPCRRGRRRPCHRAPRRRAAPARPRHSSR